MATQNPNSHRHKYRFSIPPANSNLNLEHIEGLPKISEREFGRIIVMLGANGTGKSRLLSNITHSPLIGNQEREIICLKASRDINPYCGTSEYYDESRAHDSSPVLNRRLRHMASLLESERRDSESRYEAALSEWEQKDGNWETQPQMKETAFNRVSSTFSKLFPHIRILPFPLQEHDFDSWTCESRGRQYQPSFLSDGEKQVLWLLGTVGEFAPRNALIIADEPEVNLHPKLANELWDHLEERLPNAVFIYATHSLSFAMRNSVTDVIVLGAPEDEPLHITALHDWSKSDLEPFLGSIPAVILNNKLLVIEGEENSNLDAEFFQWLVGPKTAISRVGCCQKVLSAVKKEGVWSMAGSATICGVIDRDYRTDAEIESIVKNECCILPYHEWESYLCYPQVLARAAKNLAREATETQITEDILKFCKEMTMRVAMTRTIARCKKTLSTGKSGSGWPGDFDSASESLVANAISELRELSNYPDNVKKAFREEYDRCDAAVKLSDIDGILAIFPGKELLGKLAKKFKLNPIDRILRTITWNLNPNEYQPLVKVIQILDAKLGSS